MVIMNVRTTIPKMVRVIPTRYGQRWGTPAVHRPAHWRSGTAVDIGFLRR